MERNWDPEVTNYFRKILNSFAFGMIWLITAVTAGIYYKLGFIGQKPVYPTIIFYVVMITGLVFLLRHLRRIWKK